MSDTPTTVVEPWGKVAAVVAVLALVVTGIQTYLSAEALNAYQAEVAYAHRLELCADVVRGARQTADAYGAYLDTADAPGAAYGAPADEKLLTAARQGDEAVTHAAEMLELLGPVRLHQAASSLQSHTLTMARRMAEPSATPSGRAGPRSVWLQTGRRSHDLVLACREELGFEAQQ